MSFLTWLTIDALATHAQTDTHKHARTNTRTRTHTQHKHTISTCVINSIPMHHHHHLYHYHQYRHHQYRYQDPYTTTTTTTPIFDLIDYSCRPTHTTTCTHKRKHSDGGCLCVCYVKHKLFTVLRIPLFTEATPRKLFFVFLFLHLVIIAFFFSCLFFFLPFCFFPVFQ